MEVVGVLVTIVFVVLAAVSLTKLDRVSRQFGRDEIGIGPVIEWWAISTTSLVMAGFCVFMRTAGCLA